MLIKIIIVVWLHFIADFLFQTTNIAMNKHHDSKILALHCLIYGAVMLVFGWQFALANGLTHFFIDYTTSRLTNQYWLKKNYRYFFGTIGLDQATHMTILILTLNWLVL